ncbi:hypothetical protein [Methylovirgula sp. HY1]|uniref:hypothetical protein n=1 Tax=Methylovirgula sp. HY1 TaxID=2822761 RepID=UPI001C5BC31C|nr:hypothetical protein [Methylovirgula sp. HY1]QXX73618.1 hypothetical protein MHY1_00415 [Methylovirgula sp. HY1]
MTLTLDDMASVLGPVDDTLAAELMATGATLVELEQAWAWINADEAFINAYKPLPTGRVAQLIEILAPPDDEQ